MELQHIELKLFFEGVAELALEPYIPVFHRWIQQRSTGELLIDVADYRHVYQGPGVVLVGHEGDYSVNNSSGRPGLTYRRKALLAGSNAERIAQALHATGTACERLEQDSALADAPRANRHALELSINDRLLAPNTVESYLLLEAEVRAALRVLAPEADVRLRPGAEDTRGRLAVVIESTVPLTA